VTPSVTLLEAAIIPTEKYFSALLTRYFDDLIRFIDNSAFPTSLLKAEPTYFVSKWRPYVMPRALTIFSRCSFAVTSPAAWNSLSQELRLIPAVSTFKQHLETELFHQSDSTKTLF